MKTATTSQRLRQLMAERGLKQVEIIRLCKPYCDRYHVRLNKNDLSQYIAGKVSPKQDKLTVLGLALDVNEVWLMGYDVPPQRDALSGLVSSEAPQYSVLSDALGQTAVSLFSQLDPIDRSAIVSTMQTLLQADKYSGRSQGDLADEAGK